MKIVGLYRFNDPDNVIETKYSDEIKEIFEAIEGIDAEAHRKKQSKEKTKNYGMLYSPVALNQTIKKLLLLKGWTPIKVKCNYPTEFYVSDYTAPKIKGATREIDFVKNRVGVEVQFGKYSFMVYNVAAKMTIFHNFDYIDVGVEIVPAKELQAEMSTGVSYFEQFVWDLEKRGVSDIDIPVLVIGIAQDRVSNQSTKSVVYDVSTEDLSDKEDDELYEEGLSDDEKTEDL